MKLKKSLSLITALIIISVAGGYFAGKQAGSSHRDTTASHGDKTDSSGKVLYWYDPMNPGTRFDKPGKSPFMDMDLVPRYADDERDDGGVRISSRQQQNLGVRTEKVTRRQMTFQLSAFGTVATDERGRQTIPALANGVVEKLYVNASQQFVQKNEPLALLWNPQWAAAQQEYLAVRKLGDGALTAAARDRLRFQFMPDDIIRAVERSGKPQTRMTIRAPHNGYIQKLDARAGALVNAAQPLFELASLDPVWMIIDYPENQLRLLDTGSKVEATSAGWPGKTFQGAVTELLPDLDPTTRTLKARVVLDNKDYRLKPGMFLNARLAEHSQGETSLAIPEEALISTGSSNRVLVAESDGHFSAFEVTAGRTQDGWVEILSGLTEGQSVVTSGQFLIDSEASLRSALPQTGDEKNAHSGPVYSTHGVITAVDDHAVTLSHEPVPALKWSAMTMDFGIASPLPPGLKPGDKVMFSFTLGKSGPEIISIIPGNGMGQSDHKELP